MHTDNYIVNTTGVEEDVVLILASYEGTRLIDVQYLPIYVNAYIGIVDTGLDMDGATSVSAMLVKDLTNIMPLCAGAVK